jgi:GTPase Era involved in 16S rRNA processing
MDPSTESNINILVVGCISAGKSTFINGILSNSYSCCKIKRTTMIPQVYHECQNKKFPQSLIKEIKRKNDETNRQIIKDTENPSFVFNCEEANYYINKILGIHELANGVRYSFYDMPGINDAKTKDQYTKYIQDNFYKFDVVIYLMDIKQPVGTTDVKNTLELCMEQIKKFKMIGHKKHMITIANKFDDVLDFNEDGSPVIDDEEIKEMYDELVSMIQNMSIKFDIVDLCKHTVPMSCVDVFTYRTVKYNDSPELEIKYLDKIGIDEYGVKKWKLMRKEEGRILELASTLSKAINKDDDTFEQRMRSSGFKKFNSVLKEILSYQNQYDMLIGKIHKQLVDIKPQQALNFKQYVCIFTNIAKTEEKINAIFKKTSVKLYWPCHNEMLEYLKKLHTILDALCTSNKDITALQRFVVELDIINYIYHNRDSPFQKNHIYEIDTIETLCNLLITHNKCSIVRDGFNVKSHCVFDSFKFLAENESDILRDRDALKTILFKSAEVKGVDEDLLNGISYLFSISAKSERSSYIDIMKHVLSRYFNDLDDRDLLGDPAYFFKLYCIRKSATIKNELLQSELMFFLEIILNKHLYCLSIPSFDDFSPKTSSEQALFTEKLITTYVKICNSSTSDATDIDLLDLNLDTDEVEESSEGSSEGSSDESDKEIPIKKVTGAISKFNTIKM